MLVIDLDGNSSKWKLTSYNNNTRKTSQLHADAKQLLKKIYPMAVVLEEVSIAIKRGHTSYLDFYIPMLKICVEVNGEQHYKFNSMFHTTKMDFINQQKRDREKRQWLEMNSIQLFELPYNKQSEWEDILRGRNRSED